MYSNNDKLTVVLLMYSDDHIHCYITGSWMLIQLTHRTSNCEPYYLIARAFMLHSSTNNQYSLLEQSLMTIAKLETWLLLLDTYVCQPIHNHVIQKSDLLIDEITYTVSLLLMHVHTVASYNILL